MILQALKEYYDRKASDPESDIAPEGFERKELQFLIVIDVNGKFINIEDTREKNGNKLIGKTFLLPRSEGRSGSKSYEKTFFLWDHIGYLLGLPNEDMKSDNQHQTWLKSLENLPLELKQDPGVNAILLFYASGEFEKAKNSPKIADCLKSTQCNMAFRLNSDLIPIPCRAKVQEHVRNHIKPTEDEEKVDEDIQDQKVGVCLVTGERGEIARTHGKTPIDKDAKVLVGFQRNSGYDSYGKEQGFNAPIVKATEFAYVTALNTLLKSKSQRMLVGDASVVFWSQNKSSFETDFSYFFEEPPKDHPDLASEKVRSLYESVNNGAYFEEAGENEFYILGLAPNSARISVRFWKVGTIQKLAFMIKQYFDDFSITKPNNEPEYYSIWRILVNIAVQDKSDNIPPNLAGEFMRSVIEGISFPATLLHAALRRIRSDTQYRVKPIRAALIKAYLNRYYRNYPNTNYKEVKMSLDVHQPSLGYQLGRLFSVLEKIQEEANPGLNSTIRERFYGSACATPVTVFTNLLRLKNHHLAKLENRGRVVNFERWLGEIMSNIDNFPAHLNLHEQGLFAVGYYHQRQDFFTKKEEN
jgi:CRISPR-associated protein Csd1